VIAFPGGFRTLCSDASRAGQQPRDILGKVWHSCTGAVSPDRYSFEAWCSVMTVFWYLPFPGIRAVRNCRRFLMRCFAPIAKVDYIHPKRKMPRTENRANTGHRVGKRASGRNRCRDQYWRDAASGWRLSLLSGGAIDGHYSDSVVIDDRVCPDPGRRASA